LGLLKTQRKQKEKIRWDIEDRIKKIKNDIQDYDFKITELARCKSEALEKIKTLSNAEKLIDFAEWKKNIEEEILSAEAEKESLEPELMQISNEKTSNEAALEQLGERLNSIQQNLDAIEIKEKEIQDPETKRLTEQARWEIENQLRQATQEKWELQKQLEDITILEKEQKSKINKISARIADLEDKISAREAALAKTGVSTQKIRDQISLLLVENGLEVNPDLLLNITQIDTENEPLAANQNETETKILDESCDTIKDPSAEENNKEQKLETAAAMPAEIQNEPLKQQESYFQEQNKIAPEALEIPETAETISAAQNSSVNQVSPIIEAKINPKPEQPAEIIVSTEPEQNIKQKAELEAAPIKTAQTAKTESIKIGNDTFREPVEEQPSLHNIPVFPENQPFIETVAPGNAVQTNTENTENTETIPSQSVPVSENNVENNSENNVVSDILEPPTINNNIIEDRWSQIASANNALTASEVAQTSVMPEKLARIPQRSKSSQRLIVMILVILLFIILIGGGAAIIILTKKNQSTQVVSTSVEKKQTTSQTNTANNTTGTTGNAGNTDNSRNNSQNCSNSGRANCSY